MKKIVFIDLSFHQKTKSSEFFKEILKEKYIIEELYDESWRGGQDIKASQINNLNPDIVIYWQAIAHPEEIKKVKAMNIIWIPMEDAYFRKKNRMDSI